MKLLFHPNEKTHLEGKKKQQLNTNLSNFCAVMMNEFVWEKKKKQHFPGSDLKKWRVLNVGICPSNWRVQAPLNFFFWVWYFHGFDLELNSLALFWFALDHIISVCLCLLPLDHNWEMSVNSIIGSRSHNNFMLSTVSQAYFIHSVFLSDTLHYSFISCMTQWFSLTLLKKKRAENLQT